MTNNAITYDDVLLVPNYNHYESRRDVSLKSTDKTGKLSLELPLITANMDTITEHRMATFMAKRGGMGCLHRFLSVDAAVADFKKVEGSAIVSIGASEAELARAEALRDAGANYFCVDVAHAHGKYVGTALRRLREMLPEACLIAGNVATYAGADYLAACGADLVKVGIGGGSVCTTRIKTGFGVPNLTALIDCAKIDRSIIADGGIRTPGDIVKALAFGADYVMIGGMLAGTEPTPGEPVENASGKLVKRFRGMASREAQDEFMGGVPEWKTAEGVALEVPFRQDAEGIIADIIGGLRSGLTYGGAATIRELQRKVSYVLVTQAGRTESLAHKALT